MPDVATTPDIRPEALAAVGRVLAEHGLSDRFGLYDIHEHFPVRAGEVMHEANDPARRVITRRPVPEQALPAAARPTAWRISPDGATTVDMWCCDK